MSLENQHIMPVYSNNGDVYAVLMSRELWDLVEEVVRERGKSLLYKKEPEICEPMSDWETFKDYWDFRYPFNAQVTCDHCGSSTEDWEHDDPRKFQLKTASLGGLVGFECLKCRSRVFKRHFKDKCVYECCPPKE